MEIHEFKKNIRNFNQFGIVKESYVDSIPFFKGEFWTSKQRQGNSLHEISYRACFKPQLPEFFIERLSTEGDKILDPFMGRGTTLLQAALMNRQPVGNDINPLSIYLLKPRLCPPSLDNVLNWLLDIDWDKEPKELREDLLVFYHPVTLRHLCLLREILMRSKGNLVSDWICMVALNRLTGHSSGYFSGYTLPPNQAVSIASQNRINIKRGQLPPYKDIINIIMKKSRSLLRDGLPMNVQPILSTGSADNLNELTDNSIDLMITSPPFMDIVQYSGDNWLRGWFIGCDYSQQKISVQKTMQEWENMMNSSLNETYRVLKPGGYAIIEVGEIRKGTVKLENSVLKAAVGLNLEPVLIMINEQNFTKTSSLWGISNNTKGTNTNRIIVFNKNI